MSCSQCARDIRKESFIDNMREIMKLQPEYTWERAYNDAMVLWTLHDYAAFTAMEEEVGTDRAAQLYARMWEIRSKLEWPGLCELIGKKPEDTDWTIHDIAQIMIKSFALFGNPMEIVEDTEDRVTLRCYDCPYTTQVMWNLLPPDEAEKYNQKIQVDCNYAIFETYLKLTGLYDKWVFNFPSQLCLTNQYCEFNFVRNKLDRTPKK
ncbi:MAG: hypothetical protein ISS61_00800 [Desulfobacteraceae bacterium]|nr:hypothetical protein [Desulfobacteraceae bacterium]